MGFYRVFMLAMIILVFTPHRKITLCQIFIMIVISMSSPPIFWSTHDSRQRLTYWYLFNHLRIQFSVKNWAAKISKVKISRVRETAICSYENIFRLIELTWKCLIAPVLRVGHTRLHSGSSTAPQNVRIQVLAPFFKQISLQKTAINSFPVRQLFC